MTFEYWQSTKNNAWYWHLKASNGFIIANGEGYSNKADCLHVIELIKGHAAAAKTVQI